MFILDPAFERTSHAICDLRLCAARLQDDARWPWIVLVPRQGSAREIEDLGLGQRRQLMAEIVRAGEAARAVGRPRVNGGRPLSVTHRSSTSPTRRTRRSSPSSGCK